MKEIDTLVSDIYSLIKRKDGWFNDVLSKEFERSTSGKLQRQFETNQRRPGLRLSQLGTRCPKALWHSVHTPELAEALPSWAEVKYSFGHIVEAWALALAKGAGHTVTGEQDELIVDGILGHRDAVIDGCVVDVKSASSRSFQKFKDGSLGQDDSFGYLEQLDGYILGSRADPLVSSKDVGYFLAVDKTLGHMVLYRHELREQHIRDRISKYKAIVASPSSPDCECNTIAVGQSGNIGLDVRASYSDFKYTCFPNLRTFLFEKGPVFLTHVEKRPMRQDRKTPIPEIDRHGRIVY